MDNAEEWVDGVTPRRPTRRQRQSYTAHADQEQFIVPLLRGRIEAAIRSSAGSIGRGTRVLDVGCGSQPFRESLMSLGYEYVSLDVSQNQQKSVDYVCAIDQGLPGDLVDQQFELIVCLEVLEHVADWTPAFSNLARLLRPGGQLLVTCPHFYPLHEEPYDFWRPTIHALTRFGALVGLTPISIEAAGSAWDVLGTAIALAFPEATDASLMARVFARLARSARRIALGALRAGWPQRLVRLTGPLYISNVVLFERPRG